MTMRLQQYLVRPRASSASLQAGRVTATVIICCHIEGGIGATQYCRLPAQRLVQVPHWNFWLLQHMHSKPSRGTAVYNLRLKGNSPFLILGLQQIQVGVPLVANHLPTTQRISGPALAHRMDTRRHNNHKIRCTFPQVKHRTGMIIVPKALDSVSAAENPQLATVALWITLLRTTV